MPCRPLREGHAWSAQQARLTSAPAFWETQPFYEPPARRPSAALFDSVYVSVYKGLGGIAGCLLAGPLDFVREARVWQRRQGGNLPSLWPYVLAARAGTPRAPARARPAVRRRRRARSRPASPLSPAWRSTLLPSPPTNLFHVRLRGDRGRIEDAALDLAEETGVWMFGRISGTDSPHWQRWEMACTDATLDFEDDEIAGMFARVLERAR